MKEPVCECMHRIWQHGRHGDGCDVIECPCTNFRNADVMAQQTREESVSQATGVPLHVVAAVLKEYAALSLP